MKELIIIGASGFGREVAWLVERINRVSPGWELIGFLDDDASVHGKDINGYTVLGGTEDAGRYPDAFFVCAIGAAKVRKKVIEKVSRANPHIKFATLIDPSVEMSQSVSVGEGTIICAHSLLTVNISVGSHVIINLDCTVGHDAQIQDFVTMYPSVNVSGATTIGSCVEIGTGTHIIQGKTIDSGSVIGAGAVVVKDITEQGTYTGVPAKKIS